MSDWIHYLPVRWMALVLFGFACFLAAVVFATVTVLATGERAKSFKAVSPGMITVPGMIFGLFVAFIAAQVMAGNEHAGSAVSREASALRVVTLLATGLPAEQQAKLQLQVRRYVEQAATVEWPDMARQTATFRTTPVALDEALQLVVTMTPPGAGQQTAQREIISALGTAVDARLQRITISQSQVNPVRWWCLHLLAVCELLAIAIVHCDNRLTSAIALGLFATGFAASVLLIAAHDRPFTGQISISPAPLLQIMPGEPTKQ